MNRTSNWVLAALSLAVATEPTLGAGDPERGARIYGVCATCHSLEPGKHLTGPSLADIIGRKAGTAPGFARYSKALRNAGITWDEKSLDKWIADPLTMVPDTFMTFPGIRNPEHRVDLLAFLKTAGKSGAADTPGSGMGHMMRPPQPEDLKKTDIDQRVTALRYCQGNYFVTTADGDTVPYWEFNLRLKSDSSPHGPAPGKPVIVGAGMGGDRASIVFSKPDEISKFITTRCE